METERVFKAAKSNDLERVKFFIEKKGVPVNIINKKQKTIAHVAVRNDNVDMLDYVLAKDPSLLEKKDNHNSTVLQLAVTRDALNVVEYLVENHVRDDNIIGNVVHEAIKYGHQNILRYLFEKRKIDVNQPVTNHVEPPLWLAVKHQNLNIVKYLIQVANAKITVLNSRGENILFLAVEQGNLNFIKGLLDQNMGSFDINKKRRDGKTLVHMSVIKRQMEILKYLVEEKKADVNVADKNGDIPLHYADVLSIGEDDAYDYFRYLVRHDADMNKQNKMRKTPLSYWKSRNYADLTYEAVGNDDLDILKSLFENDEFYFDANCKISGLAALAGYALKFMHTEVLRYLVKEKNATISSNELNSKFYEIVKFGNAAECKSLAELGADVKIADENGNTILHEAILRSFDDTAWYDFLIEHGCDVNQKNKKGETPLHFAIIHSFPAICKYLIEQGSDVNQKTYAGETPLQLAVSRYQYDICESLIKGGADINQKNNKGETPLHLAASKGSLMMCKDLIVGGANINQKNNRGETPLHLAQANNHQEVFTFLAYCNATIDDVNGTTVTHIASTKNQTVILEYLITEKNVDVNVQRRADGWTPLHCAAFEQHIEIFRYLVEHGANIEAKDKYGKTPLQVVKDRRFIENVKKNVPERGGRFVESVAEELKRRSRRSVREFSHTPDQIPDHHNHMKISSNVRQDGDSTLVILLSDMYAPRLQNFLMIFYAIFRNFRNPVHAEATVSTARATLQDRMDPMVESAIKSLPNFRE